LTAYNKAIDGRYAVFRQQNSCNEECLTASRELLTTARNALDENGDIDAGWKCLLFAQRLEIFSMTKRQLAATCEVLRNESDKLNTWRKQAVKELLRHDKHNALTREKAYQASSLIDEHYMNNAYKDRLLRCHLRNLAILFLIELCFLVRFVLHHECFLTEDWFLSQPVMLSAVLYAGLMGGTISAMLTAPRSTGNTRIPELAGTFQVTTLRILMGAFSGLVVVMAVRSGFGTAILQEEIAEAAWHTPITLLLAFSAGFSERMLLNIIRLFVKKK